MRFISNKIGCIIKTTFIWSSGSSLLLIDSMSSINKLNTANAQCLSIDSGKYGSNPQRAIKKRNLRLTMHKTKATRIWDVDNNKEIINNNN